MRRNYGDAAALHSTHNTQDHTHIYTPTLATCTPTEQHTTKTKHAPAAAWRRAATALCVPVSKMPLWQAAQAMGSVLPAHESLRRAGLRGPRKARPNWRGGQRLTVSLQPCDTHIQKNSHSHIHKHELTQTLKCSTTHTHAQIHTCAFH